MVQMVVMKVVMVVIQVETTEGREETMEEREAHLPIEDPKLHMETMEEIRLQLDQTLDPNFLVDNQGAVAEVAAEMEIQDKVDQEEEIRVQDLLRNMEDLLLPQEVLQEDQVEAKSRVQDQVKSMEGLHLLEDHHPLKIQEVLHPQEEDHHLEEEAVNKVAQGHQRNMEDQVELVLHHQEEDPHLEGVAIMMLEILSIAHLVMINPHQGLDPEGVRVDLGEAAEVQAIIEAHHKAEVEIDQKQSMGHLVLQHLGLGHPRVQELSHSLFMELQVDKEPASTKTMRLLGLLGLEEVVHLDLMVYFPQRIVMAPHLWTMALLSLMVTAMI